MKNKSWTIPIFSCLIFFVLSLFFFSKKAEGQNWEWVIEPSLEEIAYSPSDEVFVVKGGFAENGAQTYQSAVIDIEGNILFKLPYNNLYPYQVTAAGFIIFIENERFGMRNLKGEVVIPAQYTNLANFSEGLAVFQKDEKYGFLNTKGEVVIPAQYDYAESFVEGLAIVYRTEETEMKVNGETYPIEKSLPSYINAQGEVVFNAEKYSSVVPFKNGVTFASVPVRGASGEIINGKSLLINQKGEVLSSRYNFLQYSFDETGLVPISNGINYSSYMNNKGEVVLPWRPTYGIFSEGLVTAGAYPEGVKESWENWEQIRYGYVNLEGEWVIPPTFKEVGNFNKGKAAVKDEMEEYFLIDKSGNMIFKPMQINPEWKNISLVALAHGFWLINIFSDKDSFYFDQYLIDENLQLVFEQPFLEISVATPNLFIVRTKKGLGVIKRY